MRRHERSVAARRLERWKSPIATKSASLEPAPLTPGYDLLKPPLHAPLVHGLGDQRSVGECRIDSVRGSGRHERERDSTTRKLASRRIDELVVLEPDIEQRRVDVT